MTKGTRDIEGEKHRAGGPGKAAKEGHIDPGHSGNKPGQNQAAEPRDQHGIGKGGTHGIDSERRKAPG
jgi:hypothetical protein